MSESRPGGRRPPPVLLLRAIGPVVRWLLRSPLHGMLSGRLMLLSYVGRSSGRTYTIPVGYLPWGDDEVVSMSSRGWGVSLRDGRQVAVVVRGRRREAHPVVEETLERRADLIEEIVRRHGPRATRRWFLGLPTDRGPTRAEAIDAANKVTVVRFRLEGGELDARGRTVR